MENLEIFAEKIQHVYKLKYTYRYSDSLFHREKDSTAAHSWSMMILADFFLNYLEEISPGSYKLDKLKIYEYIMYHDLIEAETGDVNNAPNHLDKHNKKREAEEIALGVFEKKIPVYLGKKFNCVFSEYEKRATLESKFVKIMDIFESQFQCFFFPDMWKDWDEDFFKFRYYRKEFDDFPELKKIIEEMRDIFKEKGYFEDTLQ